ncbi:hypothetical protein L1887_19566 [Cichorium endivia]|nr:hypothetical protein L1887_19566 [Cichorium endivia]
MIQRFPFVGFRPRFLGRLSSVKEDRTESAARIASSSLPEVSTSEISESPLTTRRGSGEIDLHFGCWFLRFPGCDTNGYAWQGMIGAGLDSKDVRVWMLETQNQNV